MLTIEVQRIHPEAQLPFPGDPGSTGFDLRSVEDGILEPGEWKAIPTGLKVAPITPSPTVDIQIRPRSGLAFKNGITVLNAPGTIDKTYRGQILIILINHGKTSFEYKVGDRIAQMVVAPFYNDVEFVEVESLDETERNEGGFGSTGLR